ncbi:uncharacterized protein LOC128392129 isoform X2 [Panonychus citri]|uniref:uncharacterized protein LOC128392129 isoform X2 n=1 Tax=Panonychus citri TaxID=50023 RepID=UPI00230755CC|nr:uncharacterized protein LOC128392129 isoform X2 [Panonychus citri]
MVNQKQVNCGKLSPSSQTKSTQSNLNHLWICNVNKLLPNWIPTALKSKLLIRLIKLFTILCFILVIGRLILSFHVTFYLIRLILLKVKFFWDWSYVNQEHCLLYTNNQPLILIKQQQQQQHDDESKQSEKYSSTINRLPLQCYSCQDLIQIKRLSLSTHSRDQIIEDNILNRIPFIVSLTPSNDNHKNNNNNLTSKPNYDINSSNPINSWPILSNHQPPIEILSKVYSKLDNEDYVCLFASNIQVNSPNRLFHRLRQQSTLSTSWFAHWENCVSISKKAIRSLYSRPQFIPSFIELTHSNWIIISGNNYTAKTWKLFFFF